MQIEVEDNPNSGAWIQCVFIEISPAEPVGLIRAQTPWGAEEVCEVVGVDPSWRWIPARVCPVQDSSDGTVYLIHGGAWGIRLRPRKPDAGPWRADAADQWGEAYKMYGSQEDILG